MQYPKDHLLLTFYKFIYKFEYLNVKTLSDTAIISSLDAGKEKDFNDAIDNLKKCCKRYDPKKNGAIHNFKNVHQGHQVSICEFHFEGRTKQSTFTNDILRHIRNILAHTLYNECDGFYELLDKEGSRLTAFGYIKSDIFLKLINAFI